MRPKKFGSYCQHRVMEDGELVELQVQNVDLPNRGGHCLFDLETRSRSLFDTRV